MKTVHDPEIRARILERLERLAPESRRQWGRMSVAEMLFHVNAGMRIALGELHAEPVGDPAFWHTRGKAIALSDAPWPAGAPTSEEALASCPVDLSEERDRFRRLLDRLGGTDVDADWPAHPRFGPLTGREWSRLNHNHIDHHFRQFGV